MRPTRAAADRRRLEAEARLAACAADGEPLSALPAALADLGVAWVAAGRRLGLRADLLPWQRRAALLAMPEPLAPVPLAELPVALPPGLDVEPVGVVDGFEQRHLARLGDGTPVVLRTLHPAVELVAVAADHGHLDLLAPLLAEEADPDVVATALAAVAADSRQALDLALQGERLAALAASAAAAGCAVPCPLPDLCRPGLLVVTEPPAEAAHPSTTEEAATLTGRRWQALFALAWGSSEPAETDDTILPLDTAAPRWTADARPRLAGTPLAVLPGAGRDRLRRYLAALAEGDAPAAAEAFAAACGPLAPETAATLVRRLRQTAAFREAGWTGCEGLAGEMLAHQRTALLLGGRPDAAFTAFFAAVAATAVATLSLVPAGVAPDPASDPAADALRAVAWDRRLTGFFAGFADQLAPRRLGAAALSNALAAGELPGKLDRALDRLAEGGFEVRVTAPPPATGNAWLPALASVVVLAGVALAAAPLAAAFGAWGEGAITLAVAATGAALLLPSRRRPNRPPAHEPRGDRR